MRQAARLAAGALLVWGAVGAVAAEDEPPPRPPAATRRLDDAPAAPSTETVLVDRLPAGPIVATHYNSQDFIAGYNDLDSQGADDFCIPSTEASWSIATVQVGGGYNDPAYMVSQARVYFMANQNGLPGTGLYTATVSGGALGNAAAGSLSMTLSPAAQLAGGNCYWLSVQAVQPAGFFAGESWQWAEYPSTAGDGLAAVYRRPNAPSSACPDWAVRQAPCAAVSTANPDFTYRLSGSLSSQHLTPQIHSRSPAGGLNEDITLSLTGFNFAIGATLSWTVGVSPTQVFTTQVSDGSHLTAMIPAAAVGPAGQVATVHVNNPAPCAGECASNSVTFALQEMHSVFVPFIKR